MVIYEVKFSVNLCYCYFGGIEFIIDLYMENEYFCCIIFFKFVYFKIIKSIYVFENIDLIKFLSYF